MRLIDADALLEEEAAGVLKYFNGHCEYGYSRGQIEEAPTIDAVEVIHCKDCEYWRIFDNDPYCELTATRCDRNHFCSWGEKSVLRNQN